jgi:hypothetical protein
MAEFSNMARVDEADQYAYLESVEDRPLATRLVSFSWTLRDDLTGGWHGTRGRSVQSEPART